MEIPQLKNPQKKINYRTFTRSSVLKNNELLRSNSAVKAPPEPQKLAILPAALK
jgi:hypothetical protein